jgi:ABC-type phosphate/phosphonate transport system substrate-binding protein
VSVLRAHSFLGEAARPHFRAVSQLVARAAGYEPAELDEPGLERLDEIVAAPGPALIFLCGLPYVRLHDRGLAVEAIAAAIPVGETEPEYWADLVVRDGLEASSPEDLLGRRIGLNGHDSLSGYVLPYWALTVRGIADLLYDDAIVTGKHRRSLQLLAAGELDAAAIDSTVLALEARDDPAIAALRVLERLGPAPIPPVALVNGDAALAGRLRTAFVALPETEEGRAALALGLVERYVEVDDSDYGVVRMIDAAVR